MFVIKGAFKDKYLLATPMLMRIKLCVRRPFHKRNCLAFMLMQRHDFQAIDQSWMPRPNIGVGRKLTLVLLAKLVKLHKNYCPLGAYDWLMSGSNGIANIGAGRVFPMFITKHTIKDKYFFAAGMFMW